MVETSLSANRPAGVLGIIKAYRRSKYCQRASGMAVVKMSQNNLDTSFCSCSRSRLAYSCCCTMSVALSCRYILQMTCFNLKALVGVLRQGF